MADAGAEKIAKLLDEPSERLAKGAQRMVSGLGQQQGDGEQAPPKARDGLSSVRTYYASLRLEIEKVNTRDTDAKRAVVDALRRLSSGLADYDAGLQGTSSPDPPAELKKGAETVKRAARDLKRARGRL